MRVIISSSAIGIPLIALVQGIVGLIGYLVIGINEPWLWFVATTIAAMLPIVGAAVIYGPLTIMLFVQGHTGKGIAMAIWGFGVIGLVDNVFRLLVNKRLGDIHPLITIFGVVIGAMTGGWAGAWNLTGIRGKGKAAAEMTKWGGRGPPARRQARAFRGRGRATARSWRSPSRARGRSPEPWS